MFLAVIESAAESVQENRRSGDGVNQCKRDIRGGVPFRDDYIVH